MAALVSINSRITQNFHLVWFDENIDETKEKWRDSIIKLREIVHTINTFNAIDQCIDFITDAEETIFMILSGEVNQQNIPIFLGILQLKDIYIFCENSLQYDKYLQENLSVSGCCTNIATLCEFIKQAAQDHDQNALPISVIKQNCEATNQNLDTLDCSFMYTQMLKKILLTLDFNRSHFKDFITYCRQLFDGNAIELRHIDKIEREYDGHQAIRWYTYQSFLYSMLNQALRMMEADLIVNMGFFIRDLHNHIATLQSEQYNEEDHSHSFIVYRGQGLSQIDFDKLRETYNGLLAFNNFLSTSLNREVSLRFARRIINRSNLVGVLYVMKIDPSMSTTPFANVKEVSYYKREEEILFSMHSVFRIGSVEKVETSDRLWQVNLTLTSDQDPQLKILMGIMEDDTSDMTGWFQLGGLMMKVAQFDKAEHIYGIMLNQTSDEMEKANIYSQLGAIKIHQGEHREAIIYYEKVLAIQQKTFPTNYLELATCYNNIAVAQDKMSEYSKALSYYEQAVKISQQILPTNHPTIATSYNNIGGILHNMGKYSNALSYFERALKIRQETLPTNHPILGTSYINIGEAYYKMGQYSEAFSHFGKALDVQQKSLPSNHPELAISYSNIGLLLENMGEYSKSLSYHEKALEARKRILSLNHPDLATSYNNIGLVYEKMSEYSKALSYHEKALELRQKSLPVTHPDLADSYNNIGSAYYGMGDYAKALSYHENALRIRQKSLPTIHPDLADSCSNIGTAYCGMGEYSKALLYFEKDIEISEKAFPANHPALATSYNNIGGVCTKMGEYLKSLFYHKKALKIQENTLSENHPALATSHLNIGELYCATCEYSNALYHLEKALAIQQKALPINHIHFAFSYNNIGEVYRRMGDYSRALSFYGKALQVQQATLPSKHPDLGTYYNNIGLVYYGMGEYSKAASYCKHAVDLLQSSLPANHPLVQQFKENYESIIKQL